MKTLKTETVMTPLLPPVAPVTIFLVGTGVIGSMLLREIAERPTGMRLCGIANSERMAFDLRGIVPGEWEKALRSGKRSDAKAFVRFMIDQKPEGVVFVDCTASEEIAAMYLGILGAGIPIVTPNKKANSGPLERYRILKSLSREGDVPFMYDTNVGAGLPILRSIRNLIAGGDEVRSIEAVLSGTLSYLFNTFSSTDEPFSRILGDAMAMGYTEPDPRDDLSGADVARKSLILAREIGLPLEPEDIQVEPVISASAFKAPSVSVFLAKLRKLDPELDARRRDVRARGRALRYVASIKDGAVSVALRELGAESPLYHLSGSDNMVSLATRRYSKTPLVIRGPGAGADVTAGGLFAAIQSLAR